MGALRFKCDENIPRDAATLLRDRGHEVHTVHDEQLAGETDPTVVALCGREGRLLITLDLDFADVREYPPGKVPGILVLRPATQAILAQMILVEQLSRQLLTENPVGQLWIVEPGRVRVRE